MRAEFRIDAMPPSLNALMRSRSLRSGQPAVWRAIVRAAAARVQLFAEPVVITMTFHGASDADNRCKLILDGIVEAGIIRDDRFPYLFELRLRARPFRGQKHVIVELETLGPAGQAPIAANDPLTSQAETGVVIADRPPALKVRLR